MIVDGKIVPQPVVLGSKYNGRLQGAIDRSTGLFWGACDMLDKDELRIQKALCRKDIPPPNKRELIVKRTSAG